MARVLLDISSVPRLLPLILACSFGVAAYAAPAPLNSNDVSLMLRTGYSSKAILDELGRRKFADTLDEAKESKLIRAGASQELLMALKGGDFTVSAEDIAKAQLQQKELDAKRRAAATDESRKFNTLHQAKLAQDRATEAIRQNVDSHMIYEQVKGDLVEFRNGAVSRFEDSALENKKYFLIYFSAHWCAPCRKFTPGLVNYYNETAPKHPEFDVIFVSDDKSPFGMETYMREMNMPWPAIDFPKAGGKDGIRKYAGRGIPDLVLVDNSGKVLADSFKGQQYIGPASVLQALDNILTKGAPKDVAQNR